MSNSFAYCLTSEQLTQHNNIRRANLCVSFVVLFMHDLIKPRILWHFIWYSLVIIGKTRLRDQVVCQYSSYIGFNNTQGFCKKSAFT
jgi:hypothetical protein